jgi:SAM-dependent methyltransferase
VEPSNDHTAAHCPACSAPNPEDLFDCTDHFLTSEKFSIQSCPECSILFTCPQPPPDKMGSYYRSEKYVSHSNADKGIVSKVYRIVRNISVSKKYQIVNRHKTNGSLLDIGCGMGHLLNAFASKGWKVKGIEPGHEARRFAIESFNLDVEEEPAILSLPDGAFDVVSMWHVLEHVHDIRERLKQVKRVLKNDGLAVIALPNHASWDAQHYGPFWAAWDVPRHLYHFNRQAVQKLADESGLIIKAILPMKFDAYYVSILSEEYMRGRKRMVHALLNGWKSNRKASRTGEYSSLIYLMTKRP